MYDRVMFKMLIERKINELESNFIVLESNEKMFRWFFRKII